MFSNAWLTAHLTITYTKKSDRLIVNVAGSTEASVIVADDFLDSLVSFNAHEYDRMISNLELSLQELKCPKCSSSLDYSGEKRIINCGFCGATIAINERQIDARK